MEAAVHVHAAEGAEGHVGVEGGRDEERAVVDDELEPAAQMDDRDVHVALDHEAQVEVLVRDVGADVLAARSPEPGDGVEHEEAGRRIDLERVDRDRADERVDLEDDLAADRDARDRAAVGEREVRAAHETGAVVRAAAVDVVGEEDEVEVARERADVLDARARGAGDFDRDAVRATDADADAEEAGERDGRRRA